MLSPNTRLYDFNTKKAAYARTGVRDYWVIDPTAPSLTVFQLDESGEYVTLSETKGTDVFEAEWPFGVRIVPAELLGRLGES